MGASAVGIGVVLEQDRHVVAYASRTLTKSEQQYSVIQRECLAALYGMKVSALPVRTSIQTCHRSHPLAMAVSPENGGPPLSLVTSHTGV